MKNHWKDFILEHPVYSKPGMVEKFVEMNKENFEGKNEIFSANFRLLLFYRGIMPRKLIEACPFNEGYLIAAYMDYAPKGEILEELVKILDINESVLFEKHDNVQY